MAIDYASWDIWDNLEQGRTHPRPEVAGQGARGRVGPGHCPAPGSSDEVLAELAMELVRIWLELHELEEELKEVKPASMSLQFATV